MTVIIPTYRIQEKVFTFRKKSLKEYPKSNITFNLLPHLELDEEQKCIVDNLWISFKLEHPNSFAILENQQDIELNLTNQNVKT